MIIISPIIRLIAKIASLIIYLITIFCCYGGYISPNIFPLSSVAVLGMPILVTISAIITIIWFCAGRWIFGAVGVAMFIACASPIRMWFPMHSPTEAEPGAPTLTVMTWNILHGDDLEKPDSQDSRTLSTILRLQPDVVCLQEIFGFSPKVLRHFSQATMDSLRQIYPYELPGSSADSQVLSKYPLREVYFGSINHYSLARTFIVRTPTREIAMANVHLPSFLLDDKEKTLLNVRNANKEEKEEIGMSVVRKMENTFPFRAEMAEKVINGFDGLAMPTIIVGDFNDVPASWTYRLFLKDGFQDAYTATNFFPCYTFYPNHLFFHLDQIFYRGGVRPLSVEKINIRTSDHQPLIATFQILDTF